MIRLPYISQLFRYETKMRSMLATLLRKRTIKIGALAALAIIILLSVRGCRNAQDSGASTRAAPRVSVMDITPGLRRSFHTTGTVEAEKSANFLADFTSTVEDIGVSIGDRVEKGQSLLTLQALEVQQDLSTAESVFRSTAQNLTQARITGQQSVDEAQIGVKTAQINLEKLQKEDLAKRTQAEETRNAAVLKFGLSEESSKTTLNNAIRKTQTTVQNALADADSLLEYSPAQEDLTDIKETHLGVRDPTQKRKTIDTLNTVYKSLQQFTPEYTSSIALLREAEDAMHMLLTVLYNSVNSPQYTQETINSNIDTVNGHITSLRTLRSDLDTAKRSLDSTMQQRGGTSQVLIDAEAAYQTTIAGLDAALRKAELEVERAQSALESAIASARASEISALNSVNSAQGTLDLARISNDKLIVQAPFSGVVTDIPVRIGRELQPGELVLSMEDATWLKIVTFVSADEVKNITVGDIVVVEDVHEARIASVSPSADPQSKKYKVEIRVGQNTFLPGEFVALTFRTRERVSNDTRIFLPVTAVHVSAAETFVWLAKRMENGKWKMENEISNHQSPITNHASDQQLEQNQFITKKRQVQIGELSGKYIEITQGLQEGDRVIVEGGRALTQEGQIVRVAQ